MLVSLPTLLILLLVLEFVVFRFLLPATEWPDYIFDSSHQVLKLNPEGPRQGVHTKGKWCQDPATWRVNDQGWISDINYDTLKHQRRIAIIGDSFVEACQVNTGEAFPQRLHQRIKDSIAVYGIGTSNATLANYLHQTRYAVSQYNPELLIINLFYNDFSESLDRYIKGNKQSVFWTFRQMENGSFQEQAPEGALAYNSNGLKKFLGQTALYRYFKFNLQFQFWKNKKKKNKANAAYEGNIRLNKSPKQVAAIKEVTHHIIKTFKERFPQRRIIFLMDAPRKSIYNNTLEQSKISWMNRLVAEACATQGFEFIDLTPHFVADYAKHQQRMEFEEDNHWNAYGHRLVAEILFTYLEW